jgi:hypothetical protein
VELSDIWTWFADTSCRGYSPLYDRVCRAVAASDAVLDLVRDAPPYSHQPNVLLGAVHYLLLGGAEHPLAGAYAGESDDDPGPLFVDFALGRRAEVLELMASRHTNTNEVGRSALLGPALTTAAARLGEPLALVDVGCSAGLNLLCDRYRLDYGAAGSTGPADAPVRIQCEVVGGAPPIASSLPAIETRIGIDRKPVDAGDPDQARWQLACVWPDTGRLPRTRLALDEVRKSPPTIVAGDAVEAVTDVVLGVPKTAVPVVMTTWALAYLSPEDRAAFRDKLAAAASTRPIAWLTGEGPGVVDAFAGIDAPSDEQGVHASVLGLEIFNGTGAAAPELLAFVHPHGNWIDWRA